MDRNQIIGFCLGSVAGFVDTAGFVLLFGLFTAHVTGNFVLAGAAFAFDGNREIWGRLATLPVFAAAVMLAALLAGAVKKSGRNDVQMLVLVEALFLCFFAAAGLAARPFSTGGTGNPMVLLVGCLGVAAMGIHNGLMRTSLPSMAATTVMTGNFTQATLDLYEYAKSTGEARAAARARVARTLPAMGGFAIGAVLGGIVTAIIHFWGIVLPVVVLLSLAGFLQDRKQP